MNDDYSLDPDVAPRPRARRSRLDLVTLCVALLALAVALHTRLYPNWPRVEAKKGSPEAVAKRLQGIEDSVRELQESLGQRDAQGRTVSDRLLVAENQNLLFDETLGKIVAHVKTLEDSLPSPRAR
jgi:hypothetical protein